MRELWNELAQRAGVTLTDDHHAKLSRYLDLLIEANQKMNLTRITDRAAAEVQHIGDALTVLPFLPKDSHRLADVGAGGGVPGIPLAIARPDAQVILIEATKKKAAFLREAVSALELSNVQIVDQRAEDAGQGKLRESCDIALARAVATLNWLVEWCLPLVKKHGKMLAMKGPKVVEELEAAKKVAQILGGGDAVLHPVELVGTSGHVIVEIAKTGTTNPRYPRGSTVAKGKPLA